MEDSTCSTSTHYSKSSPLLTSEILNQGVLKPHFEYDGEIHEECPSYPPFFDERRKTLNYFWHDSYLKEMNTTICHIQDWFTKISFSNKLNFLRSAIPLMTDSKRLFDVAHFIGPQTKDMIYARTQFTKSSYDVAATDHNRALRDSLYEDLFCYYIKWFQNLNPREQLLILLGLTHLGGGAIQEAVYSNVVNILEQKDEDLTRRKVLEYLASCKDTPQYKSKPRQSRRGHSMIKRSLRKSKSELRKESKRSGSFKQSAQGELSSPEKIVRDRTQAFNDSLELMKNISGLMKPAESRKLSRKISSKKNMRKKSVNQSIAEMDRVQMLPLWVNRKIIAFLPEEEHHFISSVNKYWRDMVHKTQKEIHARGRINTLINSLKTSIHPVQPRQSNLKNNTKLKDKRGNQEKASAARSTVEVSYQRLDVKEVFSQRIQKFNRFLKNHRDFSICNRYSIGRLMDVNKHWIAFSVITDVEIKHNSHAGSSNLRLLDVDEKITCISFHADGVHIFTGGQDGAVKLWDFWHLKLIYPKHKGAIMALSNNCQYVASCSADLITKVFIIRDCKMIFCTVEEKYLPCQLAITNCKNPILYVANLSGQISMFKVRPAHDIRKIGDSIQAHHGEVTSLAHYPRVVLSAGVDGFVRMWATNFEVPCCIISLKNPVRVNSALLTDRKIISAGDDGKIRIWDIMSGSCQRVIAVIINMKPILSLSCIHTPSTVKLYVNCESEIRILEFERRKKRTTKCSRATRFPRNNGATFKTTTSTVRKPTTSLQKREMKLQMRQAVVPSIRPSSAIIHSSLSENK